MKERFALFRSAWAWLLFALDSLLKRAKKKWLSTGMAYVSKACVKPLWKEWPIYSYKGKACNKNRFTKLQIKLATKSGSPSLNHEGKACKKWLLKSWK